MNGAELLDAMHNSAGARVGRELTRLNGTLYVFTENRRELFEAINELEQSPEAWLFFTQPFSTHLQFIQLELARLLHNFVSSALSLIDHTRPIVGRLYTDPQRKEAYELRMKETFIDDPLSQFIKRLRVYAQHYKLPFVGSSWQFSNSDPDRRSFFLNRDTMLEFDWGSKAKEYLDSAGPRIDFMKTVNNYGEKVEHFYTWLYDDVKNMYESQLDEYARLENEYDCQLMAIKLAGYFDTAGVRMLSLARELFGDVLPEEAIEEIDSMPPGQQRARKALEVFQRHRDPDPKLRGQLEQAFLKEGQPRRHAPSVLSAGAAPLNRLRKLWRRRPTAGPPDTESNDTPTQ